ncbi:DUF5808 domain-containing protein [Mucilaginibacter sp. HD30]
MEPDYVDLINKNKNKKPRSKNVRWYVITVGIIGAIACLIKLISNSEHLFNSNNHYIAGFIYYNIADSRVFIPRGDGLGWTLNFANSWSYTVLGLIALIALYSVLRSFEESKSEIPN